ncbi:MAG: TlpA disulfide reductase family protein [Rhodoglobus sp.]
MKVPLLAAALALVVALAGCSAPGISAEYEPGGGEYVSGDGTTHFWPAGERGEPIDFAGETESGETLSSADLAGQVVLINFWYASCGPCRTEVLDLNDMYDEYSGDVAFVGVDIRDSAAQAQSFMDEFGVEYPSILDVSDNAVTLAFAAPAPPTTTPTTYLLDAEGRVAARFTSAIQSPSVVAAMIDDLLAER